LRIQSCKSSFKEVEGVLDEWIRKDTGEENKISLLNSKKGRLLLVIIICIGLLALLWPPVSKPDSSPTKVAQPLASQSLEGSLKHRLQTELAAILSQIEGAGTVEVSITLDSEGLKTYATNDRDERRQIEEGGRTTIEESSTRDLAVSSGNPLLLEEKMPEILGVLIVADGADDPQVKENLTNAASTLLDISPHRVRVMPREGGR